MSKIPTREEYLKQLRNHKDYLAVLKKAPSIDERIKIISMVEHIAGSLFDGVIPVLGTLKSDPSASEKISEALKTGEGIIKESDGSPLESDSKG